MNKLLIITWDDAWSNAAGYYDTTYTYKPISCVEVGWLVEDNDEGMVLCTSMSEQVGYRKETFIPHGMITKIEELI